MSDGPDAAAQRFMLPGGKPQPAEAPHQTAAREVYEEIGLETEPHRVEHLGQFTAEAADETGQLVKAEGYVLAAAPHPENLPAAAKIEELRWLPTEGNVSGRDADQRLADPPRPAQDGLDAELTQQVARWVPFLLLGSVTLAADRTVGDLAVGIRFSRSEHGSAQGSTGPAVRYMGGIAASQLAGLAGAGLPQDDAPQLQPR